jgi:hypothetical protein
VDKGDSSGLEVKNILLASDAPFFLWPRHDIL